MRPRLQAHPYLLLLPLLLLFCLLQVRHQPRPVHRHVGDRPARALRQGPHLPPARQTRYVTDTPHVTDSQSDADSACPSPLVCATGNVVQLRQLVEIGPSGYPGANFIEDAKGRLIDLSRMNDAKRKALAARLLTPVGKDHYATRRL